MDFEAPDGKPVDVLFALLVPMEAAEIHLRLLAQLAGLCSASHLLDDLRATASPAETLALLNREAAAYAA